MAERKFKSDGKSQPQKADRQRLGPGCRPGPAQAEPDVETEKHYTDKAGKLMRPQVAEIAAITKTA